MESPPLASYLQQSSNCKPGASLLYVESVCGLSSWFEYALSAFLLFDSKVHYPPKIEFLI